MHRNRNKFHWLQHGWHLCHNMKNAWLWVYFYRFVYFLCIVLFLRQKTSGLIKISECKQTTQHWRLTVYISTCMYNVLIPPNYFSHVISRRVLKIFIICSCIAICYILTLISYSNSDDFHVLLSFSCFISSCFSTFFCWFSLSIFMLSYLLSFSFSLDYTR